MKSVPITKPSILHIIDTMGMGGAEKLMIGVVNGLPQFEHHVIYLYGSDARIHSLPDFCKIQKLNCRSRFDVIRCTFQVKKYIKQHNIDVVHSHLLVATMIARIACPRNVKLFTTIHSLPSKNYFADNWIARWMEKLTYRKHHHIIAICEEVLKDYDQCVGLKGPYSILYNYVENIFYKTDYKRMNYNDSLNLVAVGNLRPPKNYSFLIEAFKYLPNNIHLDIYGAGPMKNELEAAIEKNKVNIRLCGMREDIYDILPRYDAFIMSSIYEGCPISLLEAMAGGMPAILSDIPVLREVTANKSIFFDINQTEDLVRKLKAIAKHEINLDEYAAANFERGKKIARKENYLARLFKLYTAPEKNPLFQPVKSPDKIFNPVLPAPRPFR